MGAPLKSCGIEHGFSKRLGVRPGRASLASVLAAEFVSVVLPAKFVPSASLSNDGTALATLNPAEAGVPSRTTTIAIPQGCDTYHPLTHEPSFPNGWGAVLPPSPKGPPWVPRHPGLDESAATDSTRYNFLEETGGKEREGKGGDSLPMNETAHAHFGESARDDARMLAEADSRDPSVPGLCSLRLSTLGRTIRYDPAADFEVNQRPQPNALDAARAGTRPTLGVQSAQGRPANAAERGSAGRRSGGGGSSATLVSLSG
jgi:hypothetical protein